MGEGPKTKRFKQNALDKTPKTRIQERVSTIYNNNLQALLPVIGPVAWPVVSPMAPARPELALASGYLFIDFFKSSATSPKYQLHGYVARCEVKLAYLPNL